MNTENILVPFGGQGSGLKALYHSFSLADRVRAKIFVLFFRNGNSGQNHVSSVESACLGMIHSACEAGMSVSFHIAGDCCEEELFNIIQTEHIDLVVIGAGDSEMETAIKEILPRVSVKIIKVGEKIPLTPINRGEKTCRSY